VQACIPHKTVLPTGVDSVLASAPWTTASAIVTAAERARDGDDFVYDVQVADSNGRICERWNGLRLHAVAPIDMRKPWPAVLLAPYIERRLADILPSGELRIALNEAAPNQDSKCSCHRPDGKPEYCTDREMQFSHSHCGSLVLTARSENPVGCDMEFCADRSEAWSGLLGEHWFSLAQMMAAESNIPMQDAATQVWTLKESLRKCGAAFDQHLQIQSRTSDGWTTLSSEGLHAATFRAAVQGSEYEIAFSFISRKPS